MIVAEHAVKLELADVSKTYERKGQAVEVLDRVNFSIYEGEFVAIVGASGCGKTTLLRIVDGLESASMGAVRIGGKLVSGPGRDRGFVFQQDNLFPWRTVMRNVTFGLELQGVKVKDAREAAQPYIDLVQLSGFENHYPHELSGGMRQRANLARAFAIKPELLLMDEPFAALDAQTRELMQDELLKIWERSSKSTIVFITHQIDEAVFLADRVVVLTSRPGRIREVVPIEFGRPRDLSLKRTPEFVAVIDHIWGLIEKEVKSAMISREE